MATGKKWSPDIELPKFMYAMKSFYSEKGLILGFEDQEKTKKITISFEKGFLAARESEEGAIMKTIENWHTYYELDECGGNIFTVKNSSYLNWFKEQSLGIYNEAEIEHYVIFAYDVISEVLSTSAPKIEIINTGK